jgi:hypothetical protein
MTQAKDNRGRCETCRWWRTEKAITFCGNKKHHYMNGYATEDAMASYETIETGPRFGCVNHEPKEGAE